MFGGANFPGAELDKEMHQVSAWCGQCRTSEVSDGSAAAQKASLAAALTIKLFFSF